MSAHWNIDHSQRLVEIVVEGPSDVRDFVNVLDAIEAENAVPYRKLLDVSRAVGQMSGDNLPAMAERVAGFREAGPFAVVVAGGPADGLARLFVLLAEAQGRGRVFRVESEARQWLDSLTSME
jgi:hypothetical protein